MTAGSIAVPTIVPLRAPVNGKLKNSIDTCTPIELKTETPNAEIYFTIDGSKPDPFAALGADRNTIKYTKPFKLREGKRNVKAIALSRDGTRESHIVTKCFEVEKCEYDKHENTNTSKNDIYEFIDELEKERKKEIIKRRGILKKIVDTTNLTNRSGGGSLSDNESSRYEKETKFLGRRFFNNKTLDLENDFANFSNGKNFKFSTEDFALKNKISLPDSSIQTLRLQKETDFLKCNYCFAARPNDPNAKYCSECGNNLPEIPQAKLIPPQSGKLGTCFFCKSLVPFNTSICVICENPIVPQLQPQAMIKLQGKKICHNCTTANPANYSTCVACDTKLTSEVTTAPRIQMNSTISEYPTNSDKNKSCSQCSRMIRSDARFCDWCGTKSQRKLSIINCQRCGGSNNPYSKFCASCGTLIQANNQNTQPGWVSQIDSKAAHILNKQYNTISTQTYGLFYTSAKGLEKNADKMEKGLKNENDYMQRKPALTAVSPGKGYWRQQMDHICAHLKAYAQNNSEFRVLVGEPKLGKINSAKVDIDSSWCTITATYPIRKIDSKDLSNFNTTLDHQFKHSNLYNNSNFTMMNTAVMGRDSSISGDSVSENDDSYKSHHKYKKPIKKKSLEKNHDEKLSGEDRQLAKELSKSGKGRPKEVKELLNEGANPNAVTNDGLSMLHLAIKNRHLECLSVLLKANANIKAKTPKGNTILHEAVLLGAESDQVIKLLIDCGADPTWKNAKNETPYELAIKENNTTAVNILGSQIGTDMMNTYLRTKSVDIRP